MGPRRDESTAIGDEESHLARLISAAILVRDSMSHSHQPPSFKAGARFALSPNAPEAPSLAVATWLRYGRRAAEVVRPCLFGRAALSAEQEQLVLGGTTGYEPKPMRHCTEHSKKHQDHRFRFRRTAKEREAAP